MLLWTLAGLGAALIAYMVLLAGLVVAGRGGQAREAARFVPDCAVLMARLARDLRLPRRQRLLLVALAAYLAFPLDLVPDLIPVAGQLDDAILVLLTLRSLLRGAGSALVHEHWPGTDGGLAAVLRLAGAPRRRNR